MMVPSLSADTLNEVVCAAEPALRRVCPRQVYNATVLYLFRGLNQKGYAARLRRLIGVSPNIAAISDALGGNGYVVKEYKIWLFYVVKHRLGHADAGRYAARWGIRDADVAALPVLSRATLAYLKSLARKYAALSLEIMDRNITSISRDIKTWLGKFVSKKHRFIYESNALGRGDIEGELLYQGMRGLLNQYPIVESKLHAQNVVKRVIHNQGINLIYKYTTQKNGRLTTEADGSHQARVVELSEVRMNMMVADTPNLDLKCDVAAAMSRVRKPKQRKFLELICGGYDEAFTVWLNRTGHTVDSNEELFDKFKSSRYMTLVLEFLGVSMEAGARFVARLQTMFSDYTNRAVNHWTALVV